MIGGSNWTHEEKSAYRSYLSIYRITDELWILISLGLFVVWSFVGPTNVYLALGVWVACGLLVYATVPFILLRVLPSRVRVRLPGGRFAGPLIPDAFRSYRELFRAWHSDTGENKLNPGPGTRDPGRRV